LNEAPWDSSDGLLPDKWAFLLFPAIQWALSGEQSAAAEAVFLRVLRFALDGRSESPNSGVVGMSSLLSSLEPLLRKVPNRIFAATIRAGLEISEPSVRAFCQLIQSVAGLATLESRMAGQG
jgi:hypothetical protein